MSNMFSGCYGLKKLILSSFNTNQITNMLNIFNDISRSCTIRTNDKKLKENINNYCSIF